MGDRYAEYIQQLAFAKDRTLRKPEKALVHNFIDDIHSQ